VLQLLDSRLAAALLGDFMGRLCTGLPRSRMSSIMSRNRGFGGGVEILVESHRDPGAGRFGAK
jgi:hypothetical protein